MQALKYIGWAIWIAAGLLTLWNAANPNSLRIAELFIPAGTKISTPVVAKPCPEPELPAYIEFHGKMIPNPVKTKMPPQKGEYKSRGD